MAEQKQTFSLVLTEKLETVNEALPKDFNKTRFVQNAIALVNENTNLQKYSQEMIMRGLLKGAYLGLDFYSKEAYLIPYGNQLNYQTSYLGAKKLAKKYSIRPIKEIDAKIVREDDYFEEKVIGGKSSFEFKPKPFNKGKVVGAFAYVIYEDGGIVVDTMNIDELETTRKHSKASNSMAWKDFTTEMYRKTVLRRLCKYIELDFENVSQVDEFMDDVVDTPKEEVPDVFDVECEVVEDVVE